MTVAPGAVDAALLRLAEYDSDERREVLYRALIDGALWVAISVAPSAEGDVRPLDADLGDAPPEFVLLEDEARRVRIPAFTLPERAEEFLQEGMTLLSYPAVALFELVVANRITAVVLNPGTKTSLRLLPGELRLLMKRELPSVGNLGVIQRGNVPTRGLDGAAAPRFVQHLVRTLRGFPLVVSARLFRMAPAGDAERVFLGIDFDERANDGDMQLTLQQLADRIISPPEYPGFELIVLTAELRTQVSTAHDPIYERAARD